MILLPLQDRPSFFPDLIRSDFGVYFPVHREYINRSRPASFGSFTDRKVIDWIRWGMPAIDNSIMIHYAGINVIIA